jgi:PAS domain S-box-containing protein
MNKKKSSQETGNKIDNFGSKHHRKSQNDSEFRALMEVSPDPIVVYDPDGKTTYINPAFGETYGWSFEELLGKRIDFVPEEEVEPTLDAWRRTLGGEKVFFETRRYTKDGRTLDIQLRTAILDKDGRHLWSIVIHRDVTPIKQAEREREKLIEELQIALSKLKILSGMLPICAKCKKIRDDKGYWNQIETYIQSHTAAEFSHSICPGCADKLYPELKIYED